MPLIGAAKQIGNRFPEWRQDFAIGPSGALLAEPALALDLVLVFGEKPGERLVFAVKVPGQVLLPTLLPQIPLAVVHEP